MIHDRSSTCNPLVFLVSDQAVKLSNIRINILLSNFTLTTNNQDSLFYARRLFWAWLLMKKIQSVQYFIFIHRILFCS